MAKRPISPAAKADPYASGIRAARAWAGLTAEELGRVVGRGPKAISDWENARAKPAAAMRRQIADACGVPVSLVESTLNDDWRQSARRAENHLSAATRELASILNGRGTE